MSKSATCQLCGATGRGADLLPAALVRPEIVKEIRRTKHSWDPSGHICRKELNALRGRYIHNMLAQERRELTSLEREVLASLEAHEVVAQNIEEEFEQDLTFGERLADHISTFGGSWTFIGLFGAVLVTWIAVNTRLLLFQPFDPYPYILLNLVLSCLAAIQAPVIMMS